MPPNMYSLELHPDTFGVEADDLSDAYTDCHSPASDTTDNSVDSLTTLENVGPSVTESYTKDAVIQYWPEVSFGAAQNVSYCTSFSTSSETYMSNTSVSANYAIVPPSTDYWPPVSFVYEDLFVRQDTTDPQRFFIQNVSANSPVKDIKKSSPVKPGMKRTKKSKPLAKDDKDLAKDDKDLAKDDKDLAKKPSRYRCECSNCRKRAAARGSDAPIGGRVVHRCDICTREFIRTSHMKAHINQHFGERPYACPYVECGRRFTRDDQLRRHERTHTKEIRYSCEVCLKAFTRADHYKRHMKTLHE